MSIFQYGIKPVASDFIELSEEEYRKLSETGEFDMGEKWFVWAHPENAVNPSELHIVNEKQKVLLLKAGDSIERYAEKCNCTFENYDQKLFAVAKMYPSIFSQGSKYERK